MTISSLSQIQQPQSIFTSAANRSASSRSTSTSSTQDPAPQISQLGGLINSLQTLQTQNPAQFAAVTQKIATNLQSAAQQALQHGDTMRAEALTKLGSDFQTASTTGQMPSNDQLQADASAVFKAGGHGAHGHRRHHSGGGSQALFSPTTTTNLDPILTGAMQQS